MRLHATPHLAVVPQARTTAASSSWMGMAAPNRGSSRSWSRSIRSAPGWRSQPCVGRWLCRSRRSASLVPARWRPRESGARLPRSRRSPRWRPSTPSRTGSECGRARLSRSRIVGSPKDDRCRLRDDRRSHQARTDPSWHPCRRSRVRQRHDGAASCRSRACSTNSSCPSRTCSSRVDAVGATCTRTPTFQSGSLPLRMLRG